MYQVRDGKKVAPTCPSCGCRVAEFEDMLYHFLGTEIRDARGCICPLYLKGMEIDPKRLDNDLIVV